MPPYLDGLLWLLLLLGPLLILTRRLHHETQAIFLLISRRPEIALTLFAVVFFPGVLIHVAKQFGFLALPGFLEKTAAHFFQFSTSGLGQLNQTDLASLGAQRQHGTVDFT